MVGKYNAAQGRPFFPPVNGWLVVTDCVAQQAPQSDSARASL